MPTVAFLTPARCVLLIGDEALYLYDSGGGKIRLVDTVPWAGKDFEEAVADIIRRECKGKPLLILNDMTDQHFKGGQRMPRVGAMDRVAVLQRKLAAAFPNYPIRGALPIKDKLPRTALKANASGGLFLFAAVPMSEPVSKTLSAARQSLASIAGFTLLPVESSDLVRALAEKAMKREKTRSRWAVLIGQHMGGGLRQVITRDGQLAMTRMTPVTDLQADPSAWVSEVAQEFKATISYLSRFGYAADDGTEVFVIATPSAGEQLRDLIDIPCNYTSYTVTEAAEALGFRIGPQDDQYHADPLHAAWAARKSRFMLPMEAPDIKKIYGPRQAAMVAALLMFCGAAYLSWTVMSQAQTLLVARGDLESERTTQADLEVKYQAELQRMQALGFDVKLIQSSLGTFKELEGGGLRPLPLLQGIAKALGQELRIDRLVVTRHEPPQQGVIDPSQPAPRPTFDAIMVLSFPPTIDPEFGVREVNDLSRRLTANLPQTYNVEVTQQVANLDYSKNTVGEVGVSSTGQQVEDFKAEITIKGPLEE